MKNISRTVLLLSCVSLFTDMASEMLYPIMPMYLKSIGFSVLFIGVLEGLAEATAGLSKGYFGKWSDQTGRRLPFVQIGYLFSAISKPMMGLSALPFWVFGARTIDRLGKGIRTGARDAMLSDEATTATKASVFGFHRAMDTLGAVLGPLSALIYLNYFPGAYKTLFYIAFFPGLLAILVTFLLKDKIIPSEKKTASFNFFSAYRYFKDSTLSYKKLVGGLLLFAVFNSSDIFLLLQAKQAGLDDRALIGIYIFYNLIYALFAYPLGILADKIGFRKMFSSGILVFAVVYLLIAHCTTVYQFLLIFALYGIYAAATEGISKAWISNISEKSDTATAIGVYSGLQSICALAASSAAGIIWYNFGSQSTFLISGIAAFLLAIYFSFFDTKKP
ncbi:MAG: MFS transporter [Saprospiraceae bacterium]